MVLPWLPAEEGLLLLLGDGKLTGMDIPDAISIGEGLFVGLLAGGGVGFPTSWFVPCSILTSAQFQNCSGDPVPSELTSPHRPEDVASVFQPVGQLYCRYPSW